MNRRATLSLTALLTLTLMAAALPAAGAQENATPARQGNAGSAQAQGIADNADVEFRLHAEDSATVTITQSWQGERAQDMRQSLDTFFGAANGTLTDEEVERIERATEQDVNNQTLPLFFFDERPVQIASVELQIEGAAGDVESRQPLTMRHVMDLNLQAAPGAQEHNLTISPLWPGQVNVSAAEGWHIAQNETLQGSPGANATGSFTAGQSMTVTFVAGQAPGADSAANQDEQPTGDGSEQPEEATGEGGAQPGERPATIPGPAGLLTLAALAAAAGLVAIGAARRRS